MAFQMAFSSKDGTDYPSSFWIPVQINIGIVDKTALLTFYGYKDQVAFLGGKSPVGTKSYSIGSDKFLTYFAVSVLATAGNTPMHQAFAYATDTLDSPAPSDGVEGASFFATATTV